MGSELCCKTALGVLVPPLHGTWKVKKYTYGQALQSRRTVWRLGSRDDGARTAHLPRRSFGCSSRNRFRATLLPSKDGGNPFFYIFVASLRTYTCLCLRIATPHLAEVSCPHENKHALIRSALSSQKEVVLRDLRKTSHPQLIAPRCVKAQDQWRTLDLLDPAQTPGRKGASFVEHIICARYV